MIVSRHAHALEGTGLSYVLAHDTLDLVAQRAEIGIGFEQRFHVRMLPDFQPYLSTGRRGDDR